jgi:hypothetical protein
VVVREEVKEVKEIKEVKEKSRKLRMEYAITEFPSC